MNVNTTMCILPGKQSKIYKLSILQILKLGIFIQFQRSTLQMWRFNNIEEQVLYRLEKSWSVLLQVRSPIHFLRTPGMIISLLKIEIWGYNLPEIQTEQISGGVHTLTYLKVSSYHSQVGNTFSTLDLEDNISACSNDTRSSYLPGSILRG